MSHSVRYPTVCLVQRSAEAPTSQQARENHACVTPRIVRVYVYVRVCFSAGPLLFLPCILLYLCVKRVRAVLFLVACVPCLSTTLWRSRNRAKESESRPGNQRQRLNFEGAHTFSGATDRHEVSHERGRSPPWAIARGESAPEIAVDIIRKPRLSMNKILLKKTVSYRAMYVSHITFIFLCKVAEYREFGLCNVLRSVTRIFFREIFAVTHPSTGFGEYFW